MKQFGTVKCWTDWKARGDKPDLKACSERAEVWLMSIMHAFRRFDFITFAKQLSNDNAQGAFLLWNAVHLFFRRGMYMNPPFPVVACLGPIPDVPVVPKPPNPKKAGKCVANNLDQVFGEDDGDDDGERVSV